MVIVVIYDFKKFLLRFGVTGHSQANLSCQGISVRDTHFKMTFLVHSCFPWLLKIQLFTGGGGTRL